MTEPRLPGLAAAGTVAPGRRLISARTRFFSARANGPLSSKPPIPVSRGAGVRVPRRPHLLLIRGPPRGAVHLSESHALLYTDRRTMLSREADPEQPLDTPSYELVHNGSCAAASPREALDLPGFTSSHKAFISDVNRV